MQPAVDTLARREAELPADPPPEQSLTGRDRTTPPPLEVPRRPSAEHPGQADRPDGRPSKQVAEARLPPPQQTMVASVKSATSASSVGVRTLQAPAVVAQVTPEYPPQALAARVEGIVVLYVRLDARGAVVESRVQKSSGNPLLDASALAAIVQWRFTAPDGAAGIAAEFFQPIPFRIARPGN